MFYYPKISFMGLRVISQVQFQFQWKFPIEKSFPEQLPAIIIKNFSQLVFLYLSFSPILLIINQNIEWNILTLGSKI
jgi:hypothetical protein